MTQTSAERLAPLLRGTPQRSRRSSRTSAWPAFVMAASILAALLLGACSHPPAVISSDRTIQQLEGCAKHDGKDCYEVTGTWLEEQYTFQRALRLRAERCEGKLNTEARP